MGKEKSRGVHAGQEGVGGRPVARKRKSKANEMLLE